MTCSTQVHLILSARPDRQAFMTDMRESSCLNHKRLDTVIKVERDWSLVIDTRC